MKLLILVTISLFFFKESHATSNDARNREVQTALHAIRVDIRALKKLGYSKAMIETEMSKCSTNGYQSQGMGSISNIFLNRLCLNYNKLYDNLPFAKSNRRKILRIVRKYGTLP